MARNTKPKQEMESAQEDASEGGEGGEGDVEDNRDIFEKALDYAPFSGTLAGGIIGGRSGQKRFAALDKKYKSVHSRWDKLRSKNQIKGLTPEEGVKMYTLEKEMHRLEKDVGGNIAMRMLIKAPIGALVGNTAGSLAKDTLQKRRK